MPRGKLISLTPVEDAISNRNFETIQALLSDFEDMEVTTPATANAEFLVRHHLNRPVTHVILMRADKAGSIYFSDFDNNDKNTPNFVALRASVVTMRVILRLQ